MPAVAPTAKQTTKQSAANKCCHDCHFTTINLGGKWSNQQLYHTSKEKQRVQADACAKVSSVHLCVCVCAHTVPAHPL
jgi:hypothetical protein